MATRTFPCTRCNGKGNIPAYAHVLGGICLKCGGRGTQARRPNRAETWAIVGADGNGAAFHAYNIKAATADKAIERARQFWAGASENFRHNCNLDAAYAIPAHEMEAV
jgi:phage gpG-like protein